jgi:tetratricopeptide (TPR) repeat protein
MLALAISSLSLLVSLVSFLLVYRQRSREDQRGIRQALTDTLSALGDVNLSMAKLRMEGQQSNDDVVALRRNYNSQRRYLANHAEFLLGQIPGLVADIDHNMLAQAFDAIGDMVRAEEHWKSCVARSPADTLKAMNLRGYARFLFYRGNPSAGRQKYEESLQINLSDNDATRRLRADTLALWFATEREFGFGQEATRRREQAEAEAKRIGHVGLQSEMLKYIEDLGKKPLVSGITRELAPSAEPAPLPPKASST